MKTILLVLILSLTTYSLSIKTKTYGLTEEQYTTFINKYVTDLITKWTNTLPQESITAIKTTTAGLEATCSKEAWKIYSSFINLPAQNLIEIIHHVYEKDKKRLVEIESVCSKKDAKDEEIQELTQNIKDDINKSVINVKVEVKNKLNDLIQKLPEVINACVFFFEDRGTYFNPIEAVILSMSEFIKCGRTAYTEVKGFSPDSIINAVNRLTHDLSTKSLWPNFKILYKLVKRLNFDKDMNKLGTKFADKTYDILHRLSVNKKLKKFK